MSKSSLEQWTPGATDLQWLCRREADADTLAQCVLNSPTQFRFWRSHSSNPEHQLVCGTRLLAGEVARIWLASRRDAGLAGIEKLVAPLVTNVHQALAAFGVNTVQMICKQQPGGEMWNESLQALGYRRQNTMISMQQSPIVVRDVCPPPANHRSCHDCLMEETSVEGLTSLEALYLATCADNADTPWHDVCQTLERPLCGRHMDDRAATGLLLVETADQRVWEVRYLGVTSTHRHQGQALCLLHRCADLAGQRNVRQLHAWVDAENVPALACYERAEYCSNGAWCCWRCAL